MRVVVNGGGPVGLLVACELRQYGIETVVLERLTAIDRRAKAGGIQGRGAAALERRGLGEQLRTAGGESYRLMAELMATMRSRGMHGHFAGLFLLRQSAYDEQPMLPVSQQALEQVLAERAAELGVEIRRGHELRGWSQDTAGVTLTVQGPDSPEPFELRADWLVGADGGRSTVRKGGSFAFPGTDGVITGYQAVAELDDPAFVGPGWNRCAGGLVVNGPTPGRLLLVGFDGPPADRDAPVTVEEFQAALRRISGTGVSVRTLSSVTRFTDNARQADSYREGRVLLAGDAAHVHSPFGGQGLNLGIGDAVNLGWKLALVALGRAPESLLDTYTAERHPVAARVLDNTRAQVALLWPGPHVDALRGVFGKLLEFDDANTWLTDMMNGNDLRYDLGAADPADPADPADLVGRFCPDLEVQTAEGPARLATLQQTGRGQLLVLDGDERWAKEAAGWDDRVDITAGTCESVPYSAMLIRPDGFTAWTAESRQSLPEALELWFGTA